MRVNELRERQHLFFFYIFQWLYRCSQSSSLSYRSTGTLQENKYHILKVNNIVLLYIIMWSELKDNWNDFWWLLEIMISIVFAESYTGSFQWISVWKACNHLWFSLALCHLERSLYGKCNVSHFQRSNVWFWEWENASYNVRKGSNNSQIRVIRFISRKVSAILIIFS